jgi:elongation factor G
MDREGANFQGAIASIQQRLSRVDDDGEPVGPLALALQYPLGSEHTFRGAVDLLDLSGVTWDLIDDPSGRTIRKEPLEITHDDYDLIQAAREELLEKIAELDDGFAEAYLAAMEVDQPVSLEAVRVALRRLTISHKITPVFCGTSLRNKGVQPLLDAVTDYLPSPLDQPPVEAVSPLDKPGTKPILLPSSANGPLCALAFKIVHDAMRGPLVFVRVFSGTISDKDTLVNTSFLEEADPSKGKSAKPVLRKERVSRVLELQADEHDEVGTVGAGNIACLVGLKHTRTGDSLAGAKDKRPLRVAGIVIPDPIFFCSVEAESTQQQKLLDQALEILCRDDPSLRVDTDPETGQTVLKGMGELHLDVTRNRLKSEYKLQVELGKVRVSYLEAVSESLSMEHTFQGVLAGKESFAALTVHIELVEEGGVQVIVAPALLDKYPDEVAAAETGVREALARGPLLGYPLTNVSVSITDFEVTELSNEMAFRTCGSRAVSMALGKMRASCVLLEPFMNATISTSNETFSDTLSDLVSRRRAQIDEVQLDGLHGQLVHCHVPLSQMVGYASELRSRTGGAGSFVMEYAEHRSMSAADQQQALTSFY